MPVTITLPATFTFESRKVAYTVGTDNPVDSLPADIIKALALHGLKQKLADALAAKDVTDPAKRVQEVYANLVAGEWAARRESGKPTLPPLESIMWDILTRLVRDAYMAEIKVTKVKELTDDHLEAIDVRVNEKWAKARESEKLRAAAQKELDARNAKPSLDDLI